MDPETRQYSRGGGCLLFLAILVGTLIGLIKRQPSLGVLGGVGAGLVLLALAWLLDRRRR